jgi:MFS family permease
MVEKEEISVMSQAISSSKETSGLSGLPENRIKDLLTREQVRTGLRDSTMDGLLYAVMAALTSGVFLTAFALALGANELQIGFIASLPLLAGIVQLPTSYWVERKSKLKGVVMTGSAVSRVFLIFMVLIPFFSFRYNENNFISILFIILFLHYIFAAVSGVAWLSWMSKLVPKEVYGRYFGYRNMLIGVVTMIATLTGGKIMSLFSPWFGEKNLFGFVILFFIALIFGTISLRFLKAVPDVGDAIKTKKNDLTITDYVQPFSDKNFRSLILFSVLWKFGVNTASPYFTVYMLLDLRLSYGEVAFLSTANTFASIIGMWMWGKLSDRFGNRPVMKVAGFCVSFIPLLWIFTYNLGFPLALILHLLGGLLWAGLNLTEVNILLKLTPKQKNTIYIGTF